MTLLPPHRSDHEDLALHEMVGWLASSLGRAIRRLEGSPAFEAVERLRKACRSRRRKESDAPSLDELVAMIDKLPLETAGVVARAFTHFFLLINTAEQVHQVLRRRERRSRADTAPDPGSYLYTLQQLKEWGVSAAEISGWLSQTAVRPVLTAHPTESTRHTVLDLQARLAQMLLQWHGSDEKLRKDLEAAMESEVELLWLTAEVRADRPSVMHEVDNVLWYLKHRFPEAEIQMVQDLQAAFDSIYGQPLDVPAFLKIGSWVGGDRDGNPLVTPEVTIEAARQAARTVVEVYIDRVSGLKRALSWSVRIRKPPQSLLTSLDRDRRDLPRIWKALQKRNADEPLRLKLGCIIARLEANLRRMQSDEPIESAGAYADSETLVEDLRQIREALCAVGAEPSARILLDPLLMCVRIHGFYGFALDVRESSDVHEATLEAVYSVLGMKAPDLAGLESELMGRRPLISSRLPLDAQYRKTLRVFESIRKVQRDRGPDAACTYIVSMTHSAEDLLRVLLLAREADLLDLAADPPRSGLDVVPLFETLADLNRAGELMRPLLESPVYRRQLEARNHHQEIMIGYSDSTKDAGLLPASWALFKAQESLAARCRDAGATVTFFHGRGGTVGRGGGSPVFRALSSLPPQTVKGTVKITEQGEVISQKYGLVPTAKHTLEVMLTGTLMASFTPWCNELPPQEESRFREVMARLAEISLPVYRKRIHEEDRLFHLFRQVTPVEELTHVHFGSRPAHRGGTKTMDSLRAIPWIFGWTQIRLNLPAWLGVGSALSEVAAEKGGLATLREMADTWCFFDDLLSKIEMICAKTDLQIAKLYMDHLGEKTDDLWEFLENEFRRTTNALLQIRRCRYLLDGQPQLQTDLIHRDRYIDPLSLLQVRLLKRKRSLREDDPQIEKLNPILGTTLNGIAQGLRNTG